MFVRTEVHNMIDRNANKEHSTVFTGSSVNRGGTGWGFTVRNKGKILADQSKSYSSEPSDILTSLKTMW